MRILSRYLLKEFSIIFLMCFFSLLVLILIGRLLHLKDLFLRQGLSFLDVLELFFYLMPNFFVLLIPISCMLAVFLSFLKMNLNNEFLAVQTCGIGKWEIALPSLFFAGICVFFSLYASFYLIPQGSERFRNKLFEVIKTKTDIVLKPNVFSLNLPNLSLYFAKLGKDQKTMHQVFMEYNNQGEKIILAKKGLIKFDQKQLSILMSLKNGIIYSLNTLPNISYLSFKQAMLVISLKNVLKKIGFDAKKIYQMSAYEIRQKQKKQVSAKGKALFKMEIPRRIALSFSSFILVLSILPLVFSYNKLRQSVGIIICLSMFVFYYFLYTFFYSLGKSASLNAFVAVWSPSFVYLFFIFIFYFCLNKLYK